ncbi:MAG: tetratricopeptide repeat protein, partial [Planctomycetaceae bacterium]
MNGATTILSQATRLRQRGEFDQAERLLRRLIRQVPDDVEGWHLLALV